MVSVTGARGKREVKVQLDTTFMPKDSGIDATVASDVGMANASSNQLNQELVFLGLAREHLLPSPVMFAVGNDSLARYGELGHCV